MSPQRKLYVAVVFHKLKCWRVIMVNVESVPALQTRLPSSADIEEHLQALKLWLQGCVKPPTVKQWRSIKIKVTPQVYAEICAQVRRVTGRKVFNPAVIDIVECSQRLPLIQVFPEQNSTETVETLKQEEAAGGVKEKTTSTLNNTNSVNGDDCKKKKKFTLKTLIKRLLRKLIALYLLLKSNRDM